MNQPYDPFKGLPSQERILRTPPWAQLLQRLPTDAPRGFPNPGYIGSNSGLEPGRDNPFHRGGPAAARGDMPPIAEPTSGPGPLPAALLLPDNPVAAADLSSPFAASSQLGKSRDLVTNETDTLVRVITRSMIHPIGICVHVGVVPLTPTAGANGRFIIRFGSGGVQMPPINIDLGSGSGPTTTILFAAPDVTSAVDVGGWGNSIVVPGNFVTVDATNVSATTAKFMAMATVANTTRNPLPPRTTQSVQIAAAGTAIFGIPAFATEFIVYRNLPGSIPFFVGVGSSVFTTGRVYEETIVAGDMMEDWVSLPNGSYAVQITNLGALASQFTLQYRLNI